MNMIKETPQLGDDPEENMGAIAQGAIGKMLGLQQDDVKPGLILAKNFMDTGRYEKAMEIYTGLLLLNPMHFGVQIGLANCAIQTQDYETAVKAASAAMAMEPFDPRPYYFSGVGCLALGHIEEAKEDFADVLVHAKTREHAEMRLCAQKLLTGLADESEHGPN